MERAKFIHGCEKCSFLGTFHDPFHDFGENVHYDLYQCSSGRGTMLARYSDDGPDYTSMSMPMMALHYPLPSEMALNYAYELVGGAKALVECAICGQTSDDSYIQCSRLECRQGCCEECTGDQGHEQIIEIQEKLHSKGFRFVDDNFLCLEHLLDA